MTKKSFKSGFDAILNNEENFKAENKDSNRKSLYKNVTFSVNVDQYEKLKALAHWERLMLKQVLFDSLEKYIIEYESKNGKILIPPKK